MCFTPKPTRLSDALCSRASSGPDTAPRLLQSSPSPRASNRGTSTGCSLLSSLAKALEHWSKVLHLATTFQAGKGKYRKLPGWLVIFIALTRGHCCLLKAISATVLLSASLKAASQAEPASPWPKLRSCQIMGPITSPQLATVA